jgi:hypothetical protein
VSYRQTRKRPPCGLCGVCARRRRRLRPFSFWPLSYSAMPGKAAKADTGGAANGLLESDPPFARRPTLSAAIRGPGQAAGRRGQAETAHNGVGGKTGAEPGRAVRPPGQAGEFLARGFYGDGAHAGRARTRTPGLCSPTLHRAGGICEKKTMPLRRRRRASSVGVH